MRISDWSSDVCSSDLNPFFVQVRSQIKAYAPLRLPITPELAESYRRQAKAAASKPRPKSPILPDDRKEWARVNSPLATMEWPEFVKLARRDEYHDFEKRMKQIGRASCRERECQYV